MALTYLLIYLLIQLSTTGNELDLVHRLNHFRGEMFIGYTRDLCQMVYDTRDFTNWPAWGGVTQSSCFHQNESMLCGCANMGDFPRILFHDPTDLYGFNLTDHSLLDFTIELNGIYRLHEIAFEWQSSDRQDGESHINQATSYVSLRNKGDWVHKRTWFPDDLQGPRYYSFYGSGSAINLKWDPVYKYGMLATHLRFHLEWNFDSPTGMVQLSGATLYGETQTLFPTNEPTRFPTNEPTRSPSTLPTDPTTDPSAQPTQNPSTTPTSASQSPTKSPTNPRSGLVSVLLDDVSVQCCNGSSQQHLSVPDDTITDITYYPCCYPSDDGYFTADGDANGMTYTYSCPSAGSSISFAQMPVTVTYATGYDPNIGTACGSHQFMSDNSFLSLFNSVSLPIKLHEAQGSYECLCSMEHPSFVAHNTSECIDNPLDDLCTVPSDITGYINVDITSYWSVERGECGCKYMFEYLVWEKTPPSGTDTIANYTLWHYIPWEVNNFTAYSREYAEQCIEVQVRICSSMCMVGLWSVSNKIVDVAMTQFDTGNYLQSLPTECYCYVMVDVCTFDPTASPSALPTVSPDISVTQVLESTQSLSESNAIGIVVSVLMIIAALSWMY